MSETKLCFSVGKLASEWLCQHLPYFDIAALRAKPDEAHLTALAEFGLLAWQLARVSGSGSPFSEFALRNAYSDVVRAAYQAAPPHATIGLCFSLLPSQGFYDKKIVDDTWIKRRIVNSMRSVNLMNVVDQASWSWVLDKLLIPANISRAEDICTQGLMDLLKIDQPSPEALYAVTHLIFYGSDFGGRSLYIKFENLDEWLSVQGGRMADTLHWDLLAELIASLHCVDGDESQTSNLWLRLGAAQERDGSFGGPHTLGRYHRCLMTVMASSIASMKRKLK